MNLKHKIAGLFVLALVAAVPAWAEKADSSKPIAISADNGMLDQLKGINVWRGNVVVDQGTLHATADEATVTRDAENRQTLHAVGKPATFRQKLDNKPEYVEGQALQIDYTSAAKLVVLTGNARIKRGLDLVTGQKITYNTETEVYQVMGGAAQGPNKGRVTVILQPQQEKSSSPKAGGKP